MKALELNPQKYDVELRCLDKTKESEEEYGMMTVDFRFGDTSGNHVFLAHEMERIGAWFTRAAKELKK
jgi:hypothetical protein